MIDLPIAEDDPEIELHPRIHLYNHLLLIVSLLILSISTYYVFQLLSDSTYLGAISNFILVFLIVVSITQIVDIVSWYFIFKEDAVNIAKISNIYMIPVIFDVILIFAFGLGILIIFLRVVIWGNINQGTMYFDEDDPLFNS